LCADQRWPLGRGREKNVVGRILGNGTTEKDGEEREVCGGLAKAKVLCRVMPLCPNFGNPKFMVLTKA